MTWREQHFGGMRDRTLENAQVYLLKQNYDLSRNSRLARIIVEKVNTTLDAEERRRQVKRVRTGELLLATRRGPLILPIRTEENLDRMIAGEGWETIRRDILLNCETCYRKLFPQADADEVKRFLQVIWQKPSLANLSHEEKREHESRTDRPGVGIPRDHQLSGELGLDHARRRSSHQIPRPAHQIKTLKKLECFLAQEANVAPAIRKGMLRELIMLRAGFYPRAHMVQSGQMPLAVMHVDVGRNLWACSQDQPLAPVVVDVLAGMEYRRLRQVVPHSYRDHLDFQGKRMARVLTQAYFQSGLISFAELEWIFLLSKATISRIIDHYHRNHEVILPCPGTVLDMGRMLTHKDVIVRRYLEGLSVLEISRHTQHNPRSVDAYLKSFDGVLILYLYGLPPSLTAQVMGRGEQLVDQYLNLIKQHLKSADEMRNYLRRRGLKIPLISEREGTGSLVKSSQ